jgi:hypothetical protein
MPPPWNPQDYLPALQARIWYDPRYLDWIVGFDKVPDAWWYTFTSSEETWSDWSKTESVTNSRSKTSPVIKTSSVIKTCPTISNIYNADGNHNEYYIRVANNRRPTEIRVFFRFSDLQDPFGYAAPYETRKGPFIHARFGVIQAFDINGVPVTKPSNRVGVKYALHYESNEDLGNWGEKSNYYGLMSTDVKLTAASKSDFGNSNPSKFWTHRCYYNTHGKPRNWDGYGKYPWNAIVP